MLSPNITINNEFTMIVNHLTECVFNDYKSSKMCKCICQVLVQSINNLKKKNLWGVDKVK
jgi:hypothetical protein